MTNELRAHEETRKRFAFQWLRYPGANSDDKDIFLTETQIPENGWKGKRVLDAGCGMGRYTQVAHDLGAEVVAFDLSESLQRLLPAVRQSDRFHLVQGDLLRLPFQKESFDIVYSLGVIHHTPSTHEALRQLDTLVKRGGTLTVWVYGTAGRWAQFKTNPLRSERKWLKRILPLVWLVVLVRECFSNAVRSITTRLPLRLLYGLCYPLAFLGAVPGLKYLTFSVHPKWRVRLQENFDWLAPPYQFHHTKEEVTQWFQDLGYENLTQISHGVVPKVGLRGTKKGTLS